MKSNNVNEIIYTERCGPDEIYVQASIDNVIPDCSGFMHPYWKLDFNPDAKSEGFSDAKWCVLCQQYMYL